MITGSNKTTGGIRDTGRWITSQEAAAVSQTSSHTVIIF